LLKWVVRTIPVAPAARAALAALAASTPAEVAAALRDAMRQHFDPRTLEALETLPRQTGATSLTD
jgi:hypothetical protein